MHRYTYSRSPDQPYAIEMLPLPKEELDNLCMNAKNAYNSLFSAVETAVRFGDDGEVFNVAQQNNTKSIAMWTTSVLFGTLEEVAALYLNEDEQVPMLLDSTRSRRLYELEKPSSDNPLRGASMRWSLWKPPSKLSNGRDVCVLEYMDVFVDRETGRRVWARSIRSVNHLCCPASQHPEGPVRTHLRLSGMIFRETDRPNVLEHLTLIHVDSKCVPSWVVLQAITAYKKAADNLNQVLKIMRQYRPERCLSIEPNLGEDDGSRDCKTCGEYVSKWTIAKRCRFCDVILCKKCVEICYQRTDASGKNHRMCFVCATSSAPVDNTTCNMSGVRYHCFERSQTHLPNAVDEQERQLLEMTLHGFQKQTSLPILKRASSEYFERRPSVSTTDSADSGPHKDPVSIRDQFENMQIFSPSNSSDNSSSAREGLKQRPRACGVCELSFDLQPRRPEPVDLSYLNDLVTPRARTILHNGSSTK